MSPFIQKLMLLCVLTLLCIYDVVGAQVNVTNGLKGNLDLTFRCRSGEPVDDVGVQVLKPGATFGWKTSFEISGRYYICQFQWKSETHEYFIYRVDRDTCTTCNWNITESGPCKVQSPNHSACDSWNNQVPK